MEQEHFKYSVFLVLNNRLVSMSVAALVLAYKRTAVAPVAPLPAYAAVSLSNVIATTCQYEALRYVSFPVQTLGKCGKMIPVMVWGRLIMGRRYGASDYVVAAAVTAGATVFLLGGDVTSSASKHPAVVSCSPVPNAATASINNGKWLLGTVSFAWLP